MMHRQLWLIITCTASRVTTASRVYSIGLPDIFACLDRWTSLLLTDNASSGSSDGMMPGFLVEEGGMEEMVIVAISLNLLTESLDRKHMTFLLLFTYERC